MGKPHTVERAKEMLRLLSKRQHSVFTGLAIIDTKSSLKINRVVETIVCFRELSNKEIEDYIAIGEPLERAGAYAIQSGAKDFVEKIEGSFSNVIGLPVEELKNELKKFDI